MSRSTMRTSWLKNLTVFVAVCALVLKSGVPLLASAAAAMRGVAVAQVCEVYGVSLPGHDHHAHHSHDAYDGHDGHDPHGHHDSGSDAVHKADHCALTGLAALAPPGAPGAMPACAGAASFDVAPARDGWVFDAAARWAARLEHGPPLLA